MRTAVSASCIQGVATRVSPGLCVGRLTARNAFWIGSGRSMRRVIRQTADRHISCCEIFGGHGNLLTSFLHSSSAGGRQHKTTLSRACMLRCKPYTSTEHVHRIWCALLSASWIRLWSSGVLQARRRFCRLRPPLGRGCFFGAVAAAMTAKAVGKTRECWLQTLRQHANWAAKSSIHFANLVLQSLLAGMLRE